MIVLMENVQNFDGAALRRYRVSHRVPQKFLAKLLGLPSVYLSQIEKGGVALTRDFQQKYLLAVNRCIAGEVDFTPVKKQIFSSYKHTGGVEALLDVDEETAQPVVPSMQNLAKSEHIHYVACSAKQVDFISMLLQEFDVPASSVARRLGMPDQLFTAKLAQQLPLYQPEYDAVIEFIKKGRNNTNINRQLSLPLGD